MARLGAESQEGMGETVSRSGLSEGGGVDGGEEAVWRGDYGRGDGLVG